ncbi:DUF2851 family protein [Muriicola sp. Z0-33]|uniref:DUF2851 family protein n=1 Tax=Muriicola sp. Z0-33 TaxID=2816957 RepID=UPI0022391339|nr:DUF2851 family protein [Muriicola sp. Z0-33]MCW5517759.1 DUF2851 family protein [Muriicola sp. Z0-33]
MYEDLIHYIWKFRKLSQRALTTTANDALRILDYGTHNHFSGPDFFNAKVEIAGQLWAGNVEMHIKGSDWYRHQHHLDRKYNNVILHVVWNNDVPIFGSDNREIPTLELRHFISDTLLLNYNQLFNNLNNNFINCEKHIGRLDPFLLDNWLERLFFERLEKKSIEIGHLLKASENNWEQVLFLLLLKNFGLKINGASFMSIGKAIDFIVVQKTRGIPYQLESILFGMAGLLESEEIRDRYYLKLKSEYTYLKNKFNLDNSSVIFPEFFKLRPVNFPTIRLSQFATLYNKRHLFSLVIAANKRAELIKIFRLTTNDYWTSHFVFGKYSAPIIKRVTPKFIDLLLINTVVPIKFCYARHLGNDISDALLELIAEVRAERNSIVTAFQDLGVRASNAMNSQAILQLHNGYCVKNKCLQCAIGVQLLNGK